MTDALSIRNMSRTEVGRLVDWAAQEGWNPGLHDAELFWHTDPEAYIAAELDAFDLLWAEYATVPKLMSVGLQGRISGHPARARALERLLDYVAGFDRVWVCRREEVARHWRAHFPPPPATGG